MRFPDTATHTKGKTSLAERMPRSKLRGSPQPGGAGGGTPPPARGVQCPPRGTELGADCAGAELQRNQHRASLLQQLAQTLARGKDHTTAIALRKLAQAGYTSLEQVDRTPDWILLSIPGVGVKRLGAARALTRSDWQPPLAHEIEATGWFLTSARCALRFWSLEDLTTVVQDSAPMPYAGRPIDARLAMDVFFQAVRKAARYCEVEELTEALQQVGNMRGGYHRPVSRPDPDPGTQDRSGHLARNGSRSSDTTASPDRSQPTRGENSHFAYSPEERHEIVKHYRAACAAREITNKDSWAQSHHGISGRTLRRYESEFPE